MNLIDFKRPMWFFKAIVLQLLNVEISPFVGEFLPKPKSDR